MEDDNDEATKLSEIFSSSTPYITRRLRLMAQYVKSPELVHWRGVITTASKSAQTAQPAQAAPHAPAPPVKPVAAAPSATEAPAPARPGEGPPNGGKTRQPQIIKEEKTPGSGPQSDDSLRMVCSACKTGMRIPKASLANKEAVSIRCPNTGCAKVFTLKKQSKPARPQAQTGR
jgi:hypothetical protein